MGFRFQKRLSILPGVRVNLSKGGVSTSLGPRGADVNIGRDGITTNAGIPGTGLSYRSKLGGHGGKLGILAVIAGLGFWAFQHFGKIEKIIAPKPAPADAGGSRTGAPSQPTTASSDPLCAPRRLRSARKRKHVRQKPQEGAQRRTSDPAGRAMANGPRSRTATSPAGCAPVCWESKRPTDRPPVNKY